MGNPGLSHVRGSSLKSDLRVPSRERPQEGFGNVWGLFGGGRPHQDNLLLRGGGRGLEKPKCRV